MATKVSSVPHQATPSWPSRRPAALGRAGAALRQRQPPIALEDIDWKDVRTLRPFLDDAGRIRPRRKTGASIKLQHAVARAVKRARFMALLPYTSEHIRTARQEE